MIDTVSRVYELAEERGLSLYQLSSLCHISFSTIRTTEKRGGQLKVDTIDRICTGLGITMSDFFMDSEKTPCKNILAGSAR